MFKKYNIGNESPNKGKKGDTNGDKDGDCPETTSNNPKTNVKGKMTMLNIFIRTFNFCYLP
jgi:hypothetical protein